MVAHSDETVIDVDRTNPILGNRYILANHNDEEERGRVIDAYVRDMDEDIRRNGPMSREIRLLAQRALTGEKLALRCWCAPRKCHASQIRERIFRFAGQDPDEFFLE